MINGYGASSNGCGSSGDYSRSQVAALCTRAIHNSDIFFAWIDTIDCSGTIAEAGYARSLGKKIWIAGPEHFDDKWFMYQLANEARFKHQDPIDALEKFLGLNVNYYEYIQSAAWRKVTEAAKERAGQRCQICNRPRSEVTLDAHHRTYEWLGNEQPDDSTALCRDCHKLFESNKRLSKPT